MIVTHSKGAYEVRFTPAADVMNALADKVVVTDANVASHWPVDGAIVLPPGEASKSIAVYGTLMEELAARRLKRGDELVALGGGVIGDLVGFAAATYMRGIRWQQVPTTLLAMVDSSIGGKVGIDLVAGKNLVGAFHPPELVFVAEEFLSTLPEREVVNGAAEVWKSGYIASPELLTSLRNGALATSRTDVIQACLEIKKQVVQEDEFETLGRRAILNFGHSVGHALEKVLGYSTLLHGEAVAIGMVVETRLAEALGYMPSGSTPQIEQDLKSQGLPTRIPANVAAEDIIDAIRLDKKSSGKGLAFSLLTGWGTCKLFTDVQPDRLREVLKDS
jgi:3-dehydroquinate synthase